ncbi:MAG: cation diffusion facilitator family transporter [Thermodesulfobacteriota bacterium]
MSEADKRKQRVAWLSVVSNTTLVLLKITVGLLIGSVSVISEAIHSAVDLVAAVIALLAVRTSSQPADQKHPFGHGKAENISGAIEALLIFGAAAWIIHEAVRKLSHPEPLEAIGWGVGVMFLSSAVNILVSQMLFQVGRETDSVALEADAWHLRTDVYTSAGVMAGLGLIWAGERFFPDLNLVWLDPAAALIVALLIIKAAYDLTVKSARDLMDASLPVEEIKLIREHIDAFSPQVRGFHRLRTRKSGAQRFVEFHLLVDAGMSVDESHRITDQVAGALEEHYPDLSVTIHIEPCHGDCEPECEDGCLLDKNDRHAVRTGRRWPDGPAGPRPRPA